MASIDCLSFLGYIFKTGTSKACPHVSGVAAIMLEKKNYSPAQIKTKIQDCSLDDLSERKDETRRLYFSPCLWS